MCGIAGVLDASAGEAEVRATLTAMSDVIAHRGPDDAGFHVASVSTGHVVGLAHRRLSIIDLSTGHQPIGNADGSVQLVFNGEIYNYLELREELVAKGYSFSTASDSETIVHAYAEWGEDCVTRFRGMFAFALWDSGQERLLLARDPFGKKPLFLYQRDESLYFGSEIKAVLAAPAVKTEPDTQAVIDYFGYRYVPGPQTLFTGITKLDPGSIALWHNGRLDVRRYWSPPDSRPRPRVAPPADVPAAFLAKLDESVRIRMVSDVPFGAFLSGGIDSSAIVALMTRHSAQPVKTFAVGFDQAGYSELEHARTVAERFGTDHHELIVSPDSLMEHLPKLVWHRDAPVAEPSDIPIYLLSLEASRTVKMVLTGEGSDELLGGYPKHFTEQFAGGYQLIPAQLRRRVLTPAVNALPFAFRRVKTAVATLDLADHDTRMIRWFGALRPEQVEDLLAITPDPDRVRSRVPFSSAPGNSALRRILYFDQTSWLPDNLLERGDRMTMAASIEARMPFMDVELAAFCSALPDQWRVHRQVRKYVLRQAMQDVLPPSILTRRKVGFRVPVDVWFRTSMCEYLTEHLTGADSRTRDLYRPEALHRVLEEHVEGRQNHEKLLWAMLTLELWYRRYW